MVNNKIPTLLYPEGSPHPLPGTYNPIALVSPEFPPTFVMIATRDSLISAQQSYDFIAKLKEHGVDHGKGEAAMEHGESENCGNKENYKRWYEEAIRPGLDWVIERLDKSG